MPGLVYVLGGPSSVGKTTAAATIAGRLGAAHLQVDTLARAAQDPRVGFPAEADGVWTLPAAQVCALLIQKGEALAQHLDATIVECAPAGRSPSWRAKGCIRGWLAAMGRIGCVSPLSWSQTRRCCLPPSPRGRRGSAPCHLRSSTPSPPPTGATANGYGSRPSSGASPGSRPGHGQPSPTA